MNQIAVASFWCALQVMAIGVLAFGLHAVI